MIKVIIFDLDGVLVDTKKIHFDALNMALKKYNFEEISFNDHTKVFDGLPTKEKLKILNKRQKLPKKKFNWCSLVFCYSATPRLVAEKITSKIILNLFKNITFIIRLFLKFYQFFRYYHTT